MLRGLAVIALALATACSGSPEGWPDLAPDPAPPVPPPTSTAPVTTPVPATTSTAPTTSTTTTTLPPPHRFSDRRFVGQPVGVVTGVTMFRGNPTRTFYGTGPAPIAPERLWRYPGRAMCGNSTHRRQPKVWCGTGWTGQPVIWERPDGVTELIFGSYDKSVHFLDAETAEPTRPRFVTGDIVKGSPALDPDGYPLYYFGSRDNFFRILALDRDEPTQLWRLNAWNSPVIWNDDWDGNPAIIDDLMFLGGENGWFYVVKLNRGYDADGLVTVDPVILVEFQGWTEELRSKVGRELSIENSVAVFEGRAYFANSGGRVVGLDITNVDDGDAPIVFDYWAGDDIDASITIDAEGMLYVAAEVERRTDRSAEVGQLLKLDPYTDGDPLVWGVPVPPRGGDGGLWATPALGDGVIYANTHLGDLLAVDTATGEVLWNDRVGPHAWSSPVVVDGQLITAVDCTDGGGLRGYDLADPRSPVPVWEIDLNSACIESSPIVWRGRIYVGSRDGFFYAFGDTAP